MKASEGKLGRVFLLHLEGNEDAVRVVEAFAIDNGIVAAQVYIMASRNYAGLIAQDPDGRIQLHLHGAENGINPDWTDADILIQEMHGLRFRRQVDPITGRGILSKVAGSKTRLVEKAAPEPEVAGPGTVPVYLFNAEFN